MTEPATAACGGIVGHAFSLCTLPGGHPSMCEWRKDYATSLRDGTKITVQVYSDGYVGLDVRYPDGSGNYGAIPEKVSSDG